MDSMQAFSYGEANRHREMMVFDWRKAAKLIKERSPSEASAGLSGDWEWTGGTIFRNGTILPKEDTYTYLASTWATPELDMDGDVVDCYLMESDTPGWGSDTYWPDEAISILSE